jgi:hypothetical protein
MSYVKRGVTISGLLSEIAIEEHCLATTTNGYGLKE